MGAIAAHSAENPEKGAHRLLDDQRVIRAIQLREEKIDPQTAHGNETAHGTPEKRDAYGRRGGKSYGKGEQSGADDRTRQREREIERGFCPEQNAGRKGRRFQNPERLSLHADGHRGRADGGENRSTAECSGRKHGVQPAQKRKHSGDFTAHHHGGNRSANGEDAAEQRVEHVDR